MNTRWSILVALTCASVMALPSPAAAKEGGEKLCEVGDERLTELSGLVATKDGYFGINDGTSDQTQVDIIGLDKSCQKAQTGVTGYLDPADPEDLAIDSDGTFWVADTGDNNGDRDTVALHEISSDGETTNTYRVSYPKGEHNNAEAMMLQGDGTPVFATWEAGKTRLFAPSGELDPNKTVPLENKGEFKIKGTDTKGGPKKGAGGAASTIVTGGAVSPDGKKVVLRTYTDAYEWKVSGDDVAKAITGDKKPAVTALPNEPQGEAITYDADGKKFITGSEAVTGDGGSVQTPAQMWEYKPAKADGGSKDKGSEGDGGPGLLSQLLGTLGINGILWIIAGIGVIGLGMVLFGGRAILKSRRQRKADPGPGSDEPADLPDGGPHDDRYDGPRPYDGYDDRYDDRYDRGGVYGGRPDPGHYGDGYGGREYGGGYGGREYGGGYYGRDDEGRSGNVYGGR